MKKKGFRRPPTINHQAKKKSKQKQKQKQPAPKQQQQQQQQSRRKNKTMAAASFDSPESAIRKHYHVLSSFELSEIYDYREIYFVGEKAKKIIGSLSAPNNSGYDDDTGSYSAVQ